MVPRFGPWVPRFGPWIPRFGPWIPRFGPWVPKFGPWVPRFGPWVPRFGTWIPRSLGLVPGSLGLVPRFGTRYHKWLRWLVVVGELKVQDGFQEKANCPPPGPEPELNPLPDHAASGW